MEQQVIQATPVIQGMGQQAILVTQAIPGMEQQVIPDLKEKQDILVTQVMVQPVIPDLKEKQVIQVTPDRQDWVVQLLITALFIRM